MLVSLGRKVRTCLLFAKTEYRDGYLETILQTRSRRGDVSQIHWQSRPVQVADQKQRSDGGENNLR